MRASTLLLAATPVCGFAERAGDSPLGCAVGCVEKAIDVAKDYCLCKKDKSQNENDASTPCVVQACFPAEAASKFQFLLIISIFAPASSLSGLQASG
jgi:hypothetical protein